MRSSAFETSYAKSTELASTFGIEFCVLEVDFDYLQKLAETIVLRGITDSIRTINLATDITSLSSPWGWSWIIVAQHNFGITVQVVP